MSLTISKKLKTYQFLFIFLLVFIFTTVLNKKSFGEKFFLINPSLQCQAYLEVFYSDILEIKDGLFIINDNESTPWIKHYIKITKNDYKNYDYHIIFKSDNSSMIISKSDSYQTGTLTIFNKINPCRSIVTKDNLYASKFSSGTLKSSDLDQNNSSPKIDEETTIAKDVNSNVEQLVLERDLLFNELVAESSILLEDIKNFLKTPNDFDAIKLGKLFLEFNSLDNKNFNEEFINMYNEIADYTKQNEKFVAYRASLATTRNTEKQNILKENLEFIKHARNRIQDYVISNLDNDNIEEAINLANVIDENIEEKEFQSLNNLKEELIIWMKKNDLINLYEEKAHQEAKVKERKLAEEKERQLAEAKSEKEAEEKITSYKNEIENIKSEYELTTSLENCPYSDDNIIQNECFGKIVYEHSEIYYGEIINNSREGNGVYIYGPDGRCFSDPNKKCSDFIYVGEFKNNKLHGVGIMKYPEGHYYSGGYKNNTQTGKATHTFPDGSKYIGSFENGNFNGIGEMYYASGNIYKGEWKNGFRDGKAIYTFSNGNIYEGEYSNKNLNGNGKYTFKDGSIYTGEFLDGSFHGEGEFIFADGRKYTGNWIDGLKEGKGIFKWTDGQTYDGNWLKDQQSGLGLIIYADGSQYEGEWLNNNPNGFGKFLNQEKSIFIGEYLESKANGEGIFIDKDEKILDEGFWQDGKLKVSRSVKLEKFPSDLSVLVKKIKTKIRVAEEKAKKEAEEKEKKLAEEKAKKEAEEKAKKDKINTAKFEALYQIISGNKLEKMVNYIFNGNFDKSENIENKYEVKIFNDNECIFGFSDSSNGYVKISFKNIDYNKIKLINDNNYFSLSIAALPNKEKAIDVKLNLENVSDSFKERITAFNSNFKEDTELSFKNFVIPLSNIKKYKEYVLNNSLLKIENELCK